MFNLQFTIKSITFLTSFLLLLSGNILAQNINDSNGGYESKRIIQGKKFRVIYDEVVIEKSVDEVWNEIAGNFMHIDQVMAGVNFTKSLSGDTTTGLGAKRFCNLDLNGKNDRNQGGNH